MKSIQPLGDRILVKRDEEKVTDAGILIPDTTREKSDKATVVAVGPGNYNENGIRMMPDVCAGDRILFNPYSGFKVEIEGIEHIIIAEGDALGVIQ